MAKAHGIFTERLILKLPANADTGYIIGAYVEDGAGAAQVDSNNRVAQGEEEETDDEEGENDRKVEQEDTTGANVENEQSFESVSF